MASYNQRKERANYWKDKTALFFIDVMILTGQFVLVIVAGYIVIGVIL